MGLFIFNKSLVSAKSTRDGSADVDLFAVPVHSLANITSTSGIVSLYFKEGNSYTALTGGTTNIRGYEYAQVELSTEVGSEQSVVREVGRLLSQVQRGERTTIIVDIPQESIQILGVTGINAIKRFNDLTTLTTDPATGGAISNVVEDTTPQLGGNLDVNGNKIVSTSNGDIDIEPNGTGDVLLGNFKFDADQSVGAGQDNYLLTYDNSSGKISLEAAAGGNEYIQFNGSANNGNSGADRYIPLGGNYVDTSSLQVYSEAMCPFAGVVESITVRTDNASGSTTTKLWVNGSAVNNSTDTLSANTPLTIAFGDSVSAGDLIACSMNTTNAAGDSYVTVLIKKS